MAGEGWGMSGWGGTLESGGGGGGGPGPVVDNFQPPEGTPIQPGTALTFDVTGPNALVALVVFVEYEQTGATEVVYNAGFTANFAPTGGFTGSERQPITDGFHFIVRRRGGWPLSPSIRVKGGDELGNPVTS